MAKLCYNLNTAFRYEVFSSFRAVEKFIYRRIRNGEFADGKYFESAGRHSYIGSGTQAYRYVGDDTRRTDAVSYRIQIF